MKRLTVILLALVLTLSLVSCGGGASGPETQGGDRESHVSIILNGDGDGDAIAPLIGWMKGGTFSYDYVSTFVSEEMTMEMTGIMAMDGEKMAMTSESDLGALVVKSKVIFRDGYTYVVDDDKEMIMIFTGFNVDMAGGAIKDYSGMVKTGSGTGEIGDKTLPYEEYLESLSGSKIKYFIEDGQVYGTISELDGAITTMMITNAKNSVPAGIFDLPAGYVEMEI